MSVPHHQVWYGAAAGYLAMWLAMMLPMMLPALIPELLRYRRSVRGTTSLKAHGLTALFAAGYYTVWAGIGILAWAGSVALAGIELRWDAVTRWLPPVTGLVLLGAGAVQLSGWKARHLARCRSGVACGHLPPPVAVAALSQGVRMGLRCSLCCGNLMLALLAVGMTNLVAMGAITVVIAVERLAPRPYPLVRVAGVVLVVLGVAIAR